MKAHSVAVGKNLFYPGSFDPDKDFDKTYININLKAKYDIV